MSTGAAILQPTYTGHVSTTHDALILFEACLSGHLNHVPRRPHDRERNSLIRSGCVFIYEENASGIKRWTDGVTWSPSRILGNFLVYRELDKPFPPGEKKRAKRKTARHPARPGEPYPRPDSTGESYSPTTPHSTSFTNAPTPSDAERQLIGSLIDSYGFKPNGLVKKTMSVTVQGVTHHLVSYYNMDDVKNGLLEQPSQAPALSNIRPRPELTSKQSFRAPLEDLDESPDGARDGHPGMYGGYRSLGPQSYYPNSNSYHPQSAYPPHGAQPAGVSASYPVGQPMGGNFMPHMPAPHIPPREGEYGGLNTSPYSRNYDSLHTTLPPSSHANSIPPTPPSVLPAGYPDRPPSQTHHSALYSQQASLQPRGMAAPSPVDTRAPGPYDRAYSTMPTVSHPSPVSHQPALEPSVKYEDRRNSQPHTPAPPYPAERQPYYMGPQGPVHQTSYPPGPPGSPWQSAGPAHRPAI